MYSQMFLFLFFMRQFKIIPVTVVELNMHTLESVIPDPRTAYFIKIQIQFKKVKSKSQEYVKYMYIIRFSKPMFPYR